MLEERKIVKRILQGDISSFEKFFRQYYAPLCGFANKYLEDMDMAEEMVQDVFYIFWEKRKTLRIETSLKSYIYRSVYNRCMMYIRHENVKIRHAEAVEKETANNPYETRELYNVNALEEVVKATLESLPERCRKVFTMNRFEGFKYREIADILSLSIKTIEADMGKALKVFRENLKEYMVADN